MKSNKIITERYICTDPSFSLTNILREPSAFQALNASKKRDGRDFLGIHIREIFQGKRPQHIEIELHYSSSVSLQEIKRVKRQITMYMEDRLIRQY